METPSDWVAPFKFYVVRIGLLLIMILSSLSNIGSSYGLEKVAWVGICGLSVAVAGIVLMPVIVVKGQMYFFSGVRLKSIRLSEARLTFKRVRSVLNGPLFRAAIHDCASQKQHSINSFVAGSPVEIVRRSQRSKVPIEHRGKDFVTNVFQGHFEGVREYQVLLPKPLPGSKITLAGHLYIAAVQSPVPVTMTAEMGISNGFGIAKFKHQGESCAVPLGSIFVPD
jgi:hypothetical protein